MRYTTTLAALLLGTMSVPALSAELFTNGSFESPATGYLAVPGASGAITGWSTVLTGVELFDPSIYGLGAAPDGSQVVDLANFIYAAGGLEQAVNTAVGQTYAVSFFAGNSIYAGRAGTGVVKVSIDGGAPLLFNTPVATTVAAVWETRSFNFVAAGSSSTIRFYNEESGYTNFAFIDGASVSAVPEPQGWALLLAGLAATAAVVRRRAVTAG